jgi:hypothetical protein
MRGIIGYSPNIYRLIKPKRLIEVGMVMKRNPYRVFVGVEKDDYEGLDLGARMLLKWISNMQDELLWARLRWLIIGTGSKIFIKV